MTQNFDFNCKMPAAMLSNTFNNSSAMECPFRMKLESSFPLSWACGGEKINPACPQRNWQANVASNRCLAAMSATAIGLRTTTPPKNLHAWLSLLVCGNKQCLALLVKCPNQKTMPPNTPASSPRLLAPQLASALANFEKKGGAFKMISWETHE